VLDRLATKLKNRRLVLIFDEFDRNFATVASRQDSILTMDNLTSLHHFSEQDQRVQFVVTYTHPVDPILNDDWYLRNFARENVDLLSELEARGLVEGGLRRRGIRPTSKFVSAILVAGGRYPPLLTLAVNYAESLEGEEYENRARSVYRHLEQYIRAADGRLQLGNTLQALAEVARNPVAKDRPELYTRYSQAKWYCYVDGDGSKGFGRYTILSEGFGSYLLNITNQGAQDQGGQNVDLVRNVTDEMRTGQVRSDAETRDNVKVAGILENLDRIVLPDCVVVGKYLRYDQPIRNTLRDWVKRIQSPLIEKTSSRENYLIWAAPGSGKTFLIQQTAADVSARLSNGLRYVECNLAKDEREEFVKKVRSLETQSNPTLCLLDEIDARSGEDWPYETCFPQLDLNLKDDKQVVIVLIGSTPNSMEAMIESMRARKKGQDLLDRILRDQKCFAISPTTAEDSVAMVVGQIVGLLGRKVRAVEKLALFYILSNESLRSSPRQLSEFIKSAANRLGESDERLRFHHLFRPEDDDQRYAFRKANESLIAGLRNVDVVVISS
jgi:hypothetical protein